MPDGVSNGQFGVGLVIDFFGLAGKNSGFPVEFVYPSVTAIVPANIALVAGARTPEAASGSSSSRSPTKGQAAAARSRRSRRLPVLPATYAKVPAGYPNPFGGSIQAKVNFDSDLSESRYYVVVSLFDQMITFRLKELQAATKAIHEAEKRLGGKREPRARRGARSSRSRRRVDDKQAPTRRLLDALQADKKDDDGLEARGAGRGRVGRKAKANYAKAPSWPTRRK